MQDLKWPNEELYDLDQAATYVVDKSNVYSWIGKSDRNLATDISRSIAGIRDKLPKGRDIGEVIVCGMGGSAIAGDVAYSALGSMLPVPYRVVRGYTPPSSLGKNSLLIVVSYSGNTEESIWAFTQGHNRGAHVVTIASGGALADLSTKFERPFVELESGCPAPRLALGIILNAILAVLDAVFDEVSGVEEMIKEAVVSLKRGARRYEKELPSQKNYAKRLAVEIHDTWPVVVGSDSTWPAALRFQTQLNENSKWPCHASRLPEMNHNEIVAYTQNGPATSRTGVILLREKDDHPRVQLRQDFTADMLEGKVAWVHQLKGEGKTPFSRLMSIIQTADYATYYLACAREIDPADISSISSLKDRMGKVK